MRVAVLKNRMLQLSDGAFHERDFGADSFTAFLSRFPSLVRVDAGQAEFLGPDDDGAQLSPNTRIRPDLWRAVLDYSSGKAYTWDANQSTVREASTNELVLPTITRSVFEAWRSDFASQHADDVGVQKWLETSMNSRELPREQQGAWNGFLKQNVLKQLEDWFSKNHVVAPPLLVERLDAPSPPLTADAKGLRALVIAIVSAMTESELEELRLPPAAIFRARSRP